MCANSAGAGIERSEMYKICKKIFFNWGVTQFQYELLLSFVFLMQH